MASSPRHIMLANLRRRQAQAEAAEAENDRTAADAHWRGVQSHAKQLAPYDPETAVPVLEAVMARFEALAAESTGYDADLYFTSRRVPPRTSLRSRSPGSVRTWSQPPKAQPGHEPAGRRPSASGRSWKASRPTSSSAATTNWPPTPAPGPSFTP